MDNPPEGESAPIPIAREKRELWASLLVALIMTAVVGFIFVKGRMANRQKASAAAVVVWGVGVDEPFGTDNQPILADINNDGVEDVIGRFADWRRGLRLVGAFDGVTRKSLWQAGPFRFSASATHVIRLGNHLAVADDRGKLVLLDLATGQQRASLGVGDRVKDVCVESDNSLWILLVDWRALRVDVAAATVSPASRQRPNRCRERPVGDPSALVLPYTPPDLLGAVRFVVSDSSRLVMAYEAKTGSTKSVRMVALDGTSLAVLWQFTAGHTAPDDTPSALAVTSTRVYLAHRGFLDIVDAKTGVLIGTIGDSGDDPGLGGQIQ